MVRRVTRIGGKVKVFKTEEEYQEYLKELRSSGRLRERKKRDRRKSTIQNPAMEQIVLDSHYEHPPKIEAVTKAWNFSIIHPSFNRPMLALDRIKEWLTYCSPHNHVDYVLSIQTEDHHGYLTLLKHTCSGTFLQKKHDLRVMIGSDQTMVGNLNEGCTFARGDVLIYVSDDFHCFPNWDVEIQKAVKGNETTPWVLFVSDGHQKDVQTISIVSRAYYEATGYMYFPEYVSMFVDNDYTERAQRYANVIKAPHLVFQHEHFIFGDRPIDDTYKRQNSPEAWAQGEALIMKRRRNLFRP